MPLPLAAMAVGAATPFIANALSKLFAGDAEAEERAALERAKAEPQRIATGGTTQGQAGLSYARARALQELAGQAQRGTAQQRAGLQREAMRTGADVQARYASQLAELRSMEQERARQRVAEIEGAKSALAGREAQRQRQMVAGAITGVATPLVTSLLTPPTAAETELARQAESAKLLGETPNAATGTGISSEEAGRALGFAPATAAAAPAAAIEAPAQRVARETSTAGIQEFLKPAGEAAAGQTLAQAAAPAAAQPGYESLYTGPSTPSVGPNQQTLASADETYAMMTAKPGSMLANASTELQRQQRRSVRGYRI